MYNKNTLSSSELGGAINQVKALMEHKDNCIHHWHKKLGHRDLEAIKKMHSKGLAGGLVIAECGIKETCDVCMKGKQRRLKQAKEEAQDEIEKYRAERERQFKEFEAKELIETFIAYSAIVLVTAMIIAFSIANKCV